MTTRHTAYCAATLAMGKSTIAASLLAVSLIVPLNLVPQIALAQEAIAANIQATHVVANIPPDDPDGGLNVRMGAGTQFGKITTLPAGTPVKVISYSAKRTWALISYGGGSQGWVHTAYLKRAAKSAPASQPVAGRSIADQPIVIDSVAPAPAYIVSEPALSTMAPDGRQLPANYIVSVPAKTQLAVRQSPDPQAKLLGSYDAGDTVRVIGWLSNGWVEVQIDSARTGFLSGRHLIR